VRQGYCGRRGSWPRLVVFVVVGPTLLRWLGPAGAAALAASAGIVRWSVTAVTAWLPAMVLVEPLHGLTFALLHLACMQMLSVVVPPALAARRAEADRAGEWVVASRPTP
jgi:MFS transporter, PPP family, 3-phenylpropionic acid transporter